MTDLVAGTFDFFATGGLPVPVVSEAEAEAIAAELAGLRGRARSLGSQQDANFLLTGADGEVLGVLKISNPAFGPVEIDAQHRAAEHLAARVPGLRVATTLGSGPLPVVLRSGAGAVARLLRHLPGGSLGGSGHLPAVTVEALGRLAGRVAVGLADFTHPALDRVLQWDLRHADRVVARLAPHVADPDLRARVEQVARHAWADVSRVAGLLPRQAVHGDLTDDNVVRAEPGHPVPDGVIDLGDLTDSWAVAELAVTLSSLLHHDGVGPVSVLPAVAAFDAERPLSDAEIEALWPLVVLRGAVLVVSGHHQLAVDAVGERANDYAAANLAHERRVFDVARSVPTPVMTALVRAHLGRPAPAATLQPEPGLLAGPLSLGQRIAVLDLSSTSDAMDGGAWLDPATEDRLAAAELDAGAWAVVTRFGEPRLTRAAPLSAEPPSNVATGVDAWWAQDVVIRAPWNGTAEDGGRRLRSLGVELSLSGEVRPVVSSGAVRRGDPLLTVPARSRLRVTARRTGAGVPGEVPPFVPVALRDAWRAFVADPSPLLGAPVRPSAPPAHLLARRSASFAPLQEHYYTDPPRIERGWREHLVDTDGRVYLDAVNNVAVLGHGHLGVADAVGRQLRRLNTNSRFHYASVVEFSERLAALLPDPLDTVFLVNSGSEAGDLALRIALATTGHRDVVAVAEAYHGWTYVTDAVSTSTADNPDAVGTRPAWVHTLDAPNTYRGRYRGSEAARYAGDAVARIDALAAAGQPPAAFIAEPVYGNAGGLLLPDGYLRAVYAAVRRHGGLAIADEVQVGYGRLGEWFWGFEQQGVVPDVVTVAKAMGNGHPLGAVITSRAVAEAYRSQGYFFSSPGGSPVSSVVGLAVLDAMEREKLQENARTVGEHLRRRLAELAERRPLIGAVHGRGFYLGVELVRDPETREPATEETAAICDRMRHLGVVIQPTGDRQNVLKLKPPMVTTRESADYFVAALDRVLSAGW